MDLIYERKTVREIEETYTSPHPPSSVASASHPPFGAVPEELFCLFPAVAGERGG